MRQIGEVKLGAVPTQKRDRAYYEMQRRSGKTWKEFECSQCDGKDWMIEAYYVKLMRNKTRPRCKACRVSDKDELQQAMINLARRKAAMKGK